MGSPTWWPRRRLGLFVSAGVSAVPAWAPIGYDAGRYRAHLGENGGDDAPRPLVEVLAHHRERWGHIERYDDFVELLTFDRFDAEAWARLAVDAGAGYAVFVARDADGWAWWDAADTGRRLTDAGPRRDVLHELAAACERNDVVFGTFYSGAERAGDDPRLRPRHLGDLLERYGARLVRTEVGSHLGADLAGDAETVLDEGSAAAAMPGGALVVRTFDHDPPDGVVEGPWELRRSIDDGIGFNRNPDRGRGLDAATIIALFTEVVAKGGHLLLGVGTTADGTIPDHQATAVRGAGAWIARHRDLLAEARPWSAWGDDRVRYLAAGDALFAVDLTGAGTFAAIDPERHHVEVVEEVGGGAAREVGFRLHADGLQVDTATRVDVDGPAVYRIRLHDVGEPVTLFPRTDAAATPLAPLLADARPGDIVQLGDGRYQGPADVPPGVILRGLGPDRTTVGSADDAPALTLGRSARVEHLRVAASPTAGGATSTPAVLLSGQFGCLLGATVDGTVAVRADDVLLRAVRVRSVDVADADRFVLSRATAIGTHHDTAIVLRDGSGHEVESCEIAGHGCGIEVVGATGSVVRGNTVSSRRCAIRLAATEHCHVVGNRITGAGRAVDVDGGVQAVVDGNAVRDGDSGCVVQGGATDCEVSGNHWERCRVGLLAWGSTGLRHRDNRVQDLREPDGAYVSGP